MVRDIREGLKENLRHNLKILRKMRGETGTDVGNAIGTPESYIYRWERGDNEPVATHLFLLAKHYGVSTEFLFQDWLSVLLKINGILEKEEEKED